MNVHPIKEDQSLTVYQTASINIKRYNKAGPFTK